MDDRGTTITQLPEGWVDDSLPDFDDDYFTLTFGETIELMGTLEAIRENVDAMVNIEDDVKGLLRKWIEKLDRAEM